MSSKVLFLAKGGTESGYRRWATSVGKKIDFHKKLRATIDACQSPWSILKRMSNISVTSTEQSMLELQLGSNNPMQFIADFLFWTNQAHSAGDKETIIANHVGRVLESCFTRWGDGNLITTTIRRKWFSKKAVQIDVACMEMSTLAGFEIVPQDVIDFITNHPEGRFTFLAFKNIDRIQAGFYSLTGFRLNLKFVNQLQKEMEKREPIVAWDDVPF